MHKGINLCTTELHINSIQAWFYYYVLCVCVCGGGGGGGELAILIVSHFRIL